MPSREEIIQELTDLGRGMVENFNQIEPQRKSAAVSGAGAFDGYSAATGYCHGVCVDWARRVLQGGRPRFGPNPQREAEQGYDYNARRQAQARRQGYAWASHDVIGGLELQATNTQKATNKAAYDQAYSNYVAAKNFLMQLHSDLVDDYNANVHMGEAHVAPITYGARLGRVFPVLGTGRTTLSVKDMRTLFENVEQRYQGLPAPVQAAPLQRSDMDQRTWKSFSEGMDANFPKGRSFGNIDLIQLHPSKEFQDMPAAIASVTQPPPTDFRSGRAMVIGIDMLTNEGEVGHAVAVHWHPNYFLLLDPNYGMFVYEELAGQKSVNSALNYLFGTAYPGPGVQVLDRIDYEIFAKRD